MTDFVDVLPEEITSVARQRDEFYPGSVEQGIPPMYGPWYTHAITLTSAGLRRLSKHQWLRVNGEPCRVVGIATQSAVTGEFEARVELTPAREYAKS